MLLSTILLAFRPEKKAFKKKNKEIKENKQMFMIGQREEVERKSV